MKKSTRRKVWRTEMHPVNLAVLALPSAKEGLLDLLIIEASAIARLPAGNATARDVWFLGRMVEHARAMALAGIGPEVIPPCDVATSSIQKIEKRPSGFYLGDIVPLAELHRWHQVQREEGTAADYLCAVHASARRCTPVACPR
ncbi:hypothetical protein [Acidovorax radicis]|uniref:hypothetical protein n=1 Tax=Acidovorax radicis TaxID=758826 RepID=UPI001CF9DD98|nr:hypothetical protein [Acidovorax radicis]UCV00320.1 hypothetical protein KI609_05920 [Acidovorax radicis]